MAARERQLHTGDGSAEEWGPIIRSRTASSRNTLNPKAFSDPREFGFSVFLRKTIRRVVPLLSRTLHSLPEVEIQHTAEPFAACNSADIRRLTS